MRTKKNKEEELLDQFVTKPPLINWIESRLQNDGRLGINIGIQEGLTLKALCSEKNVEKVVEIGTQYGCSASWMAMGLGSTGQIFTFEQDPECINNCKETFQHPNFQALDCSVRLFEGDARENLKRIETEGPFDLVFIDANKSGYSDYLHWAKANLTDNGQIVVDNIYLFGTMFMQNCPPETPKKMWSVMRSVIEEQLQDPDYSTYIIPTVEGLLVSRKRAKV